MAELTGYGAPRHRKGWHEMNADHWLVLSKMPLGGSLAEGKRMWERARVVLWRVRVGLTPLFRPFWPRSPILSHLPLMCLVLTRAVVFRVWALAASMSWAQLLVFNRPIKDTINGERQRKETSSMGAHQEEKQRYSCDSCICF